MAKQAQINTQKQKDFETLTTRISMEDAKKLKILKEKHCINISALIRQSINEMYEKLENI